MAAPVVLSTSILPSTSQSSPSHSSQHNEIARRVPWVSPGAPTGDAAVDSANLEDAIAALTAYDTLFLTKGEFLVNASRNISVNDIEITGPARLKVADGSSITYIFNVSGQRVRISGLLFNGNNAGTTGLNAGIHWASGSVDNEADFCSFINFDGPGIIANENNSGTCARCHVKNSIFYSNTGLAIHYQGTTPGSQITGNHVRDGRGIAINTACVSMRIMFNDLDDIIGIGIELWAQAAGSPNGCHRSIVSFNVIRNAASDVPNGWAGMGISIAASNRCIVEGNEIFNVVLFGIEFAESRKCECIDNIVDTVTDTTNGAGIVCSFQLQSPEFNIYAKNIVENARIGIYMHSGYSGVQIEGNQIFDCNLGIFLRNPSAAITKVRVGSNLVLACVNAGLTLEANVTETQVHDNDFRGNNTGAASANVVDSGVRTQFRNNRGTGLGNEIWILPYRFVLSGSPAPTGPSPVGSTADGRRMPALVFDETADSEASALADNIPTWWQGLAVNCQVFWSPQNTNVGNVRWLVRIAAVEVGQQTDKDYEDTDGVISASPTIADQLALTDAVALTVPAGIGVNNTLSRLSIYRDTATASNLNGDAYFHALKMTPIDP